MSVRLTDTILPGAYFYVFIEQIPIFQGAFLTIIDHIGNFQEGTPLRTDISALGLDGCF